MKSRPGDQPSGTRKPSKALGGENSERKARRLIFKALGNQPRPWKKENSCPRAAIEGRWAEEKIVVSRLRSYGTINGNEVFVARNPGRGSVGSLMPSLA